MELPLLMNTGEWETLEIEKYVFPCVFSRLSKGSALLKKQNVQQGQSPLPSITSIHSCLTFLRSLETDFQHKENGEATSHHRDIESWQ